jgi:hypothetical protein
MIRFLKLFWFDVKGYLLVRSVLRKQKNAVDFNRLGLRVDWVNRAYTVINPSEEDKGDSEEVLRIKAQNKMLPIHRYMDKIGLSELVTVSVERVPETNSYLLVYYPIMRVTTTWGLVIGVLSLIACAWALIIL